MPNSRFNQQVGQVKPTTAAGPKPKPSGQQHTQTPESTAKWPGLPGKAGPNRSAGVPKVKVSPKSEGL